MTKDRPEPVDLLKEYLKGLPIEVQLDELLKSFVDMLEYIMFLGLHDDYLIWEDNKQEYKKMKMLTQDFYRNWKQKNQNPDQEN
tara:strand:- start:118 stop:369 length:252 start_codon:yes stop_codon:yes gene_type:complete